MTIKHGASKVSIENAGVDLVEWIEEIGYASVKETLLNSGMLDPLFYRSLNNDITAEVDVYDHYLQYGAAEGRKPSFWFNSIEYREMYGDVSSSSLSSVVHYLRFGYLEGRFGTKAIRDVSESGLFDAKYYSKLYPDIIGFAGTPLQHFMAYGAYENRQPSAGFDLADFFRRNPEVRPTECNPLVYHLKLVQLGLDVP